MRYLNSDRINSPFQAETANVTQFLITFTLNILELLKFEIKITTIATVFAIYSKIIFLPKVKF